MNSPEDYQEAVDRWRNCKSSELEINGADGISVSVELFGVARLLAKTQLSILVTAARSDSRERFFSPR